jgi:hypothetical protein
MKKIDKFVYFYEVLNFLDRYVTKYSFQLSGVLQLDNKYFSDPIDELIHSRLFVIDYELVKKLWNVYSIAEENFRNNYFAGFVLL